MTIHTSVIARCTAMLTIVVLGGLMAGQRVVSADGIGVFPSSMDLDDLLRGGEYLRTIGVENTGDTQRTFTFEASGDPKPWISFVDAEDRVTPVERLPVAPRARGQVLMRLQVPADAPNGEYSGAVLVLTGVESERKGEVALNVGAEIRLKLNTTGEQKVSASLADLSVSDTEVGRPLQISSTITNTGNVKLRPEIRLTIANGGAAVGSAVIDGDPVPPGDSRRSVTEWDASRLLPGDYRAQVILRFGPLELGKKDMPFRVLQAGALTRRGELVSLKLANEPAVGAAARVKATFANTGQIDSRAQFAGELYRGQTLVTAVTSVEKLIPQGATADVEVVVNIAEAGDYVLRGKVIFEGRESQTRDLAFKVADADGSPGMATVAGLGAGAGLVAAVGLWSFRRARRSRAQGTA